MSAAVTETALQFGGGGFLRAFANLFLHEANAADDELGRAVVVTSTDSPRSRWINEQAGRYHVLLRGLRDGAEVDETIRVDRALSRALTAADQWCDVLDVACSPDLRWIVSNTTEAGFALDPADDGRCPIGESSTQAPRSFPAKLLAVLAARATAGLPNVAVLPCELIEDNGTALRQLLERQAEIWSLSADLLDFALACPLPSTLVDRIVSGRPDAHPLLDTDPLLTAAEPFASWVVQDVAGLDLFAHPAITRTADVGSYSLRKVRILNGAHTALVCRAQPLGFDTVGQAVADPAIAEWLRRLLSDEILPAVDDRIAGGPAFVESTLERFANPYLQHRLADIALHHETKMATRLLSTYHEIIDTTGEPPPLLHEVVQPYL